MDNKILDDIRRIDIVCKNAMVVGETREISIIYDKKKISEEKVRN